MARKEYMIVLDTETANTFADPLPYHIAWAITDRQGNIVERRDYVISDIFIDNMELMKTAYYKDKFPRYVKELADGKRKLASLIEVRRQMNLDIITWDVRKVGAYNIAFDLKALNTLTAYITKSQWRSFFPEGLEFFDIWNMACDILLNRPSYIKFATDNGFISEKGNILTNAECAYRYIIKDAGYSEEHMALEDVLIEVAIMAYCYRQHKKFDKTINVQCWRKVQKARR